VALLTSVTRLAGGECCIEPGEFAEALQALRSGVAYANVHTNKHPGGEIRGQVKEDASGF
jgi:hypothetical protein